jgi:hypothetical protein
MVGLWYLPLVLAGLLGSVLLACARAGAGTRSPDAELRQLVREQRLAALAVLLRRGPAHVRSLRHRSLRNRLLLDLGDVELDLHCYSTPPVSVDLVLAVSYQSAIGWVIETWGARGSRSVYAWFLDVHAVPARW